jgi:putative flippase GtrA
MRLIVLLASRFAHIRAPFIRFLLSGGLNTAATYLLYLLLLYFLPYSISYTVSFIAGIVIAYFLNRLFVFRNSAGWRTVTLFPLVYLIQYLAGLGIVLIWVEVFGWSAFFAPLAAIIFTIPLTFILSYWVFNNK